MRKIKIKSAILKKIYRPAKHSHKGDNGRLLVVAGSVKYHGAMFLCAAMAAKIVDFLYIHTTPDNFKLIGKIREKLAEFIYINQDDLEETISEVDAILVGPGLLPDQTSKNLVRKILVNYPEKKIVLDAGALRVVNKDILHKNCVITPHKQEFQSLFKQPSTQAIARDISLRCPAVIVLKGATDYVVQTGKIFYNTTGNAGMTKGGTGDVLSGLLAALLTKQDPLTAAQQAVYTNGLAGDRLFKKYKYYYSATELIPMVQQILAKGGLSRERKRFVRQRP